MVSDQIMHDLLECLISITCQLAYCVKFEKKYHLLIKPNQGYSIFDLEGGSE